MDFFRSPAPFAGSAAESGPPGVLNGASPFFYGVGVAARIGVRFLENSSLAEISPPIIEELFLLYRLVPLSDFSDTLDFFDVVDIILIGCIIFFLDIIFSDVGGVGWGEKSL